MNPKPRTAIADRARIMFGTLIRKTGRFSVVFSGKSLLFDITVINPPPFLLKTLPKPRSLSFGEIKNLLCCTVIIFTFPEAKDRERDSQISVKYQGYLSNLLFISEAASNFSHHSSSSSLLVKP